MKKSCCGAEILPSQHFFTGMLSQIYLLSAMALIHHTPTIDELKNLARSAK
jgi:hypothetical protein